MKSRAFRHTEQLEPRCLFSGDLTGAFTGVIPTALLPGGKNKLAISVTNEGDTDVTDAFRTALFASTDQTLDDADIRIFSVDKHSKIKAAGGTASVKLSFPSPTDVPDGDYFILAKIDETGGIAENSEDNNVASTPATVQIRQPFVDLSGTLTATAGTTVTIVTGKKPKPPKASLVVGNSGNVAAFGILTASFFASPDTVAGNSDDIALGTITKKTGTKPGKTLTVKPKFVIPESIRSGAYHVAATYTYSGPIADSNTANNSAVSAETFTVNNPNVPAGPIVSNLSADSTVLAVNSPEQLIFDVSVTSVPAGTTITAELDEVDSAGTLIGKVADLLDNGSSLNSDATAGDGIFTASTAIQFNAPGDRFFQAKLTGTSLQTTLLKISGIEGPSDQQVQQAIDFAAARQAQLDAAIGAGQSAAAALEAVRQTLLASPNDVRTDSIQVGDTSIAWLSAAGVLSFASAGSPAVSATSLESLASTAADQALLDCGCADPVSAADDPATACAKAIILDPTGSANSGVIASRLISPINNPELPVQTGFNVATRFGGDASVDAFKALGQNKVILITAESFDVPGFGVGIKTAQDATVLSRLANLGDLTSNRLAISGDGKYVATPKFFSHYNGDMNDTLTFVNANSSAKDNGLATAFLRRGAKAFAGFTGQVQPDLAGDTARLFFLGLADANLTVEEAVAGSQVNDPFFVNSKLSFSGTGEAKLEPGCDLLAENDLVISYTWNQNVRDLDTGTSFLGDSVGFSCGSGNEFMTFTGDNTTGGGSETVTIDLNAAFVAGRFSGSTNVTANAGWFQSAGGSGPAVLTVSLKNKTTGELRQSLTRSISPGTQSGCAATLVGSITITLTQDSSPRVSITLN